jgi:hypothetical protein
MINSLGAWFDRNSIGELACLTTASTSNSMDNDQNKEVSSWLTINSASVWFEI